MNSEEWKNIFVNAGSFIIGLLLACGQLYTILKIKKQEIEKQKQEKLPKAYGQNIIEQNKYSTQIQEQLEELRQELGADAVQVLEFHNGTDFSTRKGYKIDCTYETMRYGIEPNKNVIQNYPTTLLPMFICNIIEDEKYFCADIKDIMKKDMSTYAIRMNMGIYAFYDFILESHNMPIGIISVQYAKPTALNDGQLALIKAKKIIIETLLK